MPEIPELTVLRENLERLIVSKTLTGFHIIKPYIQKTPLPDDLGGQKVHEVRRRGKYISIGMNLNRFIIHLMLAGRFKLTAGDKKPLQSAAALMVFEDASIQLIEDAKLKRMSLWIVDNTFQVDDLRVLGPEPLAEEFTVQALAGLLQQSRERLKLFLVNQNNIAGIGNAYSDEICWHAELSPFKPAYKLNDSEITRLYTAIRETLNEAIVKTRELTGASLDIDESRPFLAVHRRKDEPCPRCGKNIEWVSTTSRDTYYCPLCQTSGRILADGRRSRFLR